MIYSKRILWLMAASILATGVFYAAKDVSTAIVGFDAAFPAFFISLAIAWLSMFVANLPSWALLRLVGFPNSRNVTLIAGILAYPLLYSIMPLVFSVSWFLGVIIAVALSYTLADQSFNMTDIPEKKRRLMLITIFLTVSSLFGLQILF